MRLALTAIALALIASTAQAAPASKAAPAGRIARCHLMTSDPSDYNGPCRFTPGPKGSFVLGPAKGKVILDVFSSISVDIVGPDKAEVRGLGMNGVNSRWGEAKRRKRDPACWQGDDFSICVY